MTHSDDLVRESVHGLFSDPVSVARFRKWKVELTPGIAGTLSGYAFGEIFWRKALGRPNTAKLSEGFRVEAWENQMVLVGDVGGPAQWKPIRAPYSPSWWDGKDDAEYWRLAYMVPNLRGGKANDGLSEHDTYTFIVPHLVDTVSWKIPGGWFGIGSVGLRTFEPPRVAFVKVEGSVRASFEVVMMPPFVSP